MNELISLLGRHGYLVVAAFVFLEAIGFPIPAALALIAAGALSAWGKMRLDLVLADAVFFIVLGDSLLFFAGRHMGWTLLAFLCRIAANPESCMLRSAESFYRRGRLTLVIAKFIPAINTMAPPLAGSMKMRAHQFLYLDAAGAVLYISAYVAVGYVFSSFIGTIVHGFHTASRVLSWAMLVGIIAYAAYHAFLYWRHRVYRIVPRVLVQELAAKLDGPEADRIFIADVRSHGYYDSDAARIRGAVRLEPNLILTALKDLPKDKEIYLYCT